ncbi:hypothetical protein LXL04_033682 [Taraxacum kok-saghyz]
MSFVPNQCLKKRNARKAQNNIYTAGPKSFVRVREEMMNENLNREQPESTQMFERTCKGKIGNVYCEMCDDTTNKYVSVYNCKMFNFHFLNKLKELMKNYQPPEDVTV